MSAFDRRTQSVSASAATRVARVLVVDDERHAVAALRRTLEDHYAVDVAGSAAEAQAILEARQGETPFDVILCDQRMPGITGIEFLKHVRQKWPDIVRVVISGYTDAEDIIAGINEAGVHRYVMKPWLPDQLVALVREAASLRDDAQAAAPLPRTGTLQQRLDTLEAAVLRETLRRHRGDTTDAAKELHLSPADLRQKLQRFGLGST